MDSIKAHFFIQRRLVSLSQAKFGSVGRIQQDSDHPSRNSHKPAYDPQFTCSRQAEPRHQQTGRVVAGQIQSVETNSTQESNSMEAIGLLVTFEARAGKEADAEAFLKSA
jgi:hypothetical protein